jgi:alkaline phosphatase
VYVGRVLTAIALTFAVGAPVAAPAAGQRKPKNVILMISDGWSHNAIAATRFYRGRSAIYDRPGWARAFMSTYPGSVSAKPESPSEAQKGSYDGQAFWSDFAYANAKATDSAAAATTMATGIKTYNNSIGMDMSGKPVTDACEVAKAAGKSAGVITTVQFSHATPAGFAAHNVSRNNYEAIAREMLTASRLDVIMGAGHPEYDDNHGPAKNPSVFVGGDALWSDLKAGRLIGADADGDGERDAWSFVDSRQAFLALAKGKTPERVCGVLQVHTTSNQARAYGRPRNPVPTLADMTLAAINVLDDNKEGFFLMVEAGAIDWASHSNQPDRLIEEQNDFNEAVRAAVNWVTRRSSWRDTVIVVTGDHETGYLCGPGSGAKGGKSVWNEVTDNGPLTLPGMEFHSTGHTNSLIPLFARGAGSADLIGRATGTDPRRGRYLDNADLGKFLIETLRR